MLEKAQLNELEDILGDSLFSVWQGVCELVESEYEMDTLWNHIGKAWEYEYKYRRGGKTLCTLYAKENCFGFMIIFGKLEREKFEAERENYSKEIVDMYDSSKTYHDGKWMMFEPTDSSLFDDFKRLLAIKRRPNKK